MDALARVFAFCAIATVIVFALIGQSNGFSFELILTGTLITSVFGVLSRWAKSATLREAQRSVDATARSIWQEVQEGKRPRFHLYLRPFDITNKARVLNRNYGTNLFSPRHYEEQSSTDFESILEDASSLPLIALGRPGEAIGAGRISTNEGTWWECFLKLADAAEKLFVVPSDNSGTKREIEWIKSTGNLKKCVFICPPRGVKVHIESNSDWDRAAGQLGIQLPAYTSYGKLFRVADDGRLVREVKIGASNRRAVSGAIVAVEGLEIPESQKARSEDNSLSLLSGYTGAVRMDWFVKIILILLAGMIALCLIQLIWPR
jgi:hypothetical protein